MKKYRLRAKPCCVDCNRKLARNRGHLVLGRLRCGACKEKIYKWLIPGSKIEAVITIPEEPGGPCRITLKSPNLIEFNTTLSLAAAAVEAELQAEFSVVSHEDLNRLVKRYDEESQLPE